MKIIDEFSKNFEILINLNFNFDVTMKKIKINFDENFKQNCDEFEFEN